MNFEKLTESINSNSFNIVVSHSPFLYEECLTIPKIDIQLSGHTHSGQIFPSTLIVKMLFKNPYGLLTQGNFNLIVTSGMWIWGPPIRNFTNSEIVIVNLIQKISN